MNTIKNCPIIIGGVGGSGTRVLVHILKKTGCYFGDNLNEANDAMSFVHLYDNWIPKILDDKISKDDEVTLLSDIRKSIDKHINNKMPYDRPWGWKNPRSIYLLKYFHFIYPNMKFIHLIRDGRDMAFSYNQNQVNMYERYILNENQLNQEPYKRSMIFWNNLNLLISDYCDTNFRENYLCLFFEELCSNPEKTITKLCDFCNVSPDNVDQLIELVQIPKTLGRWKLEEKEKIDELCFVGQKALAFYGYL